MLGRSVGEGMRIIIIMYSVSDVRKAIYEYNDINIFRIVYGDIEYIFNDNSKSPTYIMHNICVTSSAFDCHRETSS